MANATPRRDSPRRLATSSREQQQAEHRQARALCDLGRRYFYYLPCFICRRAAFGARSARLARCRLTLTRAGRSGCGWLLCTTRSRRAGARPAVVHRGGRGRGGRGRSRGSATGDERGVDDVLARWWAAAFIGQMGYTALCCSPLRHALTPILVHECVRLMENNKGCVLCQTPTSSARAAHSITRKLCGYDFFFLGFCLFL